MLTDKVTGRKMRTLDVFAAAITYMTGVLSEELKKRGFQENNSYEYFALVITVPAIWSEAAKQFMRKAVEKVGN